MGVPEARAGEILDMIMEGARSLALVQKINEKEYISLDGAGGAHLKRRAMILLSRLRSWKKRIENQWQLRILVPCWFHRQRCP
jgi:hypothetical protein